MNMCPEALADCRDADKNTFHYRSDCFSCNYNALFYRHVFICKNWAQQLRQGLGFHLFSLIHNNVHYHPLVSNQICMGQEEFGSCNSFCKLHSAMHALLVVTCLLHIGILKTCAIIVIKCINVTWVCVTR